MSCVSLYNIECLYYCALHRLHLICGNTCRNCPVVHMLKYVFAKLVAHTKKLHSYNELHNANKIDSGQSKVSTDPAVVATTVSKKQLNKRFHELLSLEEICEMRNVWRQTVSSLFNNALCKDNLSNEQCTICQTMLGTLVDTMLQTRSALNQEECNFISYCFQMVGKVAVVPVAL